MTVNFLTEKIADCFRAAFVDLDGLTTQDVKKCGVGSNAQSEEVTRYANGAAYENADSSMLMSHGFSQKDVGLLMSVDWHAALFRRIKFLESIGGERRSQALGALRQIAEKTVRHSSDLCSNHTESYPVSVVVVNLVVDENRKLVVEPTDAGRDVDSRVLDCWDERRRDEPCITLKVRYCDQGRVGHFYWRAVDEVKMSWGPTWPKGARMFVALPFIEGWTGVEVSDTRESADQCRSLPPMTTTNETCGQPDDKGAKPLKFESLYGDLISAEEWDFEKFAVRPRPPAKIAAEKKSQTKP